VLRPAASMMEDGNGVGAARVLVLDGRYMMAGHTVTFGYREFKNTDDYRNDLIGMVFVPIGEQTRIGAVDERASYANAAVKQDAAVREFGTVLIDDGVFALPASDVVEAIEAGRMHSASTLKPLIAGILNYQDTSGQPTAFVPVVDLRYLMNPNSRHSSELGEIVIVRRGRHKLGLLIGSLLDVLEFGDDQIEPPLKLINQKNYICNLIKTGNRNLMIQVIDVEKIFKVVFEEDAGLYRRVQGEINTLAG
jgi:chemotaxis signal transduction protein